MAHHGQQGTHVSASNTCAPKQQLPYCSSNHPQEVIDAVISHNHSQPVSASPAAAQAGDAELARPPLTSAPYVHPRVPMAVMMPGEGPLPVDYSVTGGKEVVISRKAGEAVLRGAPVYAPGVLACSAGVSAGDLVALTVAVELPGRWDGEGGRG